MEATWDDEMLWRCAADGDELMIPDWIKSYNNDVYFSEYKPSPEPEPNPEPDEDHVFEDPGCRSYLLKVEKHPDDALFQQQLGDAQRQYTKHHNYSQRVMDALAKDVVVKILYVKHHNWIDFRQLCLSANDHALYHRSIEGAAYLVFMIYSKVSLFRDGHNRTSNKQMDELHEEVVAQGVEACPDYEVGKLIVRLMADKKKYSFVTEVHLAEMLNYYPRKIPTGPIADDQGQGSEKYEDQVFNDITKVVREMKPSSLPILKVDDHTRLLINFLKKESLEEIPGLVREAMARVKPDAVQRFYGGDDLFMSLWVLLLGLFSYIRLMLQGHLSRVIAPLFELYNPAYHVSSEIIDIFEVAEIRRMALGSRFVGRSHLIWAIYELGYGLPPKIRHAIEITSIDKDVPPYHIYVAAMKLAEYLGVENMQLEHFIYAVIFSKEDIGFEGKQLGEMAAHFNEFIAGKP
ncbi:hypothetical protein KSS87_002336 [Heliosperma pusillum]|nr:hypothetical protein KSS87_002336 [Heliosperma pusillum]